MRFRAVVHDGSQGVQVKALTLWLFACCERERWKADVSLAELCRLLLRFPRGIEAGKRLLQGSPSDCQETRKIIVRERKLLLPSMTIASSEMTPSSPRDHPTDHRLCPKLEPRLIRSHLSFNRDPIFSDSALH
jgi:hypothetical protein